MAIQHSQCNSIFNTNSYPYTTTITTGTPNVITTTNPYYTTAINPYSTVSTTINDVVYLTAQHVEFFELILAALGIDLTFEKFNKMTQSEKKQFLRDIKISKLLEK